MRNPKFPDELFAFWTAQTLKLEGSFYDCTYYISEAILFLLVSYAILITYIGMSMEAFFQFFYAKYGIISESYALEMIGRPGYPKT